jgi:hypothetical protein
MLRIDTNEIIVFLQEKAVEKAVEATKQKEEERGKQKISARGTGRHATVSALPS